MTVSSSKQGLPRRRGRVAAVLALLICAGVVVAIVVSNGASASGGASAGTTATGAATVQRRDLVATDTESGTLSYADSQTVYNRLSGTITWLPAVGKVIRPGHALFTVDNKPVLLMDGSTPAFRDLTASDETGPDIYELNRNLVDLGYNPDGIVVDDTWQTATTAGVDELQTHLGETATGALTLGHVVFLPGPQMIQTIDTTAGSTGGAAASYTPPAGGSSEFVDFAKDSTGTTADATGTGTTGSDTTARPPPGRPTRERPPPEQPPPELPAPERRLPARQPLGHTPPVQPRSPRPRARQPPRRPQLPRKALAQPTPQLRCTRWPRHSGNRRPS